MSAAQGSALTAIAFQLAATLESYEENIGALVRTPGDLELYQRISRQVDEMRMYSAAWPSLSVAWIEVLIRHFEVTHTLWQQQQGAADAACLAQRHEHLQSAITRLRQLCRRAISAP